MSGTFSINQKILEIFFDKHPHIQCVHSVYILPMRIRSSLANFTDPRCWLRGEYFGMNLFRFELAALDDVVDGAVFIEGDEYLAEDIKGLACGANEVSHYCFRAFGTVVSHIQEGSTLLLELRLLTIKN